MQFSPRVLGVSAAVLVAGVAAGAALGSVPPMQQRGVHELLPQANTVALDYPETTELPDHYPLVTRTGRFEVHELGERGLYSQARYHYLDAYYPVEEYDAGYGEEFAGQAEPAVVAAVAAAPATSEAQPLEPTSSDADAPLAPVGPAVAEVTPRIVDVAAELAGRY